MSFQGLFAVFAAVWIGFQILGVTVGSAPKLRAAVISFVNLQIPGLIASGGPIDPGQLAEISGWGWSSAIAAVLLVWTAIAWLNYTRIAMRRIFRLSTPPVNVLLLKVYDLVVALVFGLFIVASSAGTVLLTTFMDEVAAWLGDATDSSVRTALVQVVSFVLLYGVDVLIVGGMIYLLSGIPIPTKRLFAGAALGAIALDILKIGAGFAFHSTGHNPLFASFAIFIGLLIWFNFACRIYLLTAAWIGAGLERDGIEAGDLGWVISSSRSRA